MIFYSPPIPTRKYPERPVFPSAPPFSAERIREDRELRQAGHLIPIHRKAKTQVKPCEIASNGCRYTERTCRSACFACKKRVCTSCRQTLKVKGPSPKTGRLINKGEAHFCPKCLPPGTFIEEVEDVR